MSVVIAFIADGEGRLLITQRALDSLYGGYWELPGGKIEDRETSLEALTREIEEELGLLVDKAELFASLDHGFVFYLYHVQAYRGELSLNVNQISSKWILKDEIKTFQFPETNEKFFDAWFKYLEFHNSHINHKI